MKTLIIAVALLFSVSVAADAGTAFLVGEESGAFNKICYYDYLGDTYTKNVSSLSLCPLSISVRDTPKPPSHRPATPPAPSYGTAFFVREEAGSFTKTCYYDYLGDTYTKDVSSVSLCPLTLKIRK